MTALSDSVDSFHAAIRVVEAALLSPTYDLLKDRDNIVGRFEAAWIAVKAEAKPTAHRDDVRTMLAENANRYRDCARRITEMRDPKTIAKRKVAARAMRRNADVERFVVEEVAAFWKRDIEGRAKRS